MKKKTIALMLVMMMVFGITVGGTIAYLTDSKQVVNTFTVGNVQIKLTEAPVDANGQAIQGDRIEGSLAGTEANAYKLIPNGEYDKDPTVEVLAGSEDAYVRMLVTIDYSAEWDAIFDALNEDAETKIGAADVFTGMGAGWELKKNTENATANTRTYEFWYNDVVSAEEDVPALFTGIKIPGAVTNEQLATLVTKDADGKITDKFTITIEAHAIQEAGFNSPEEAWGSFTK